MKQILILKDVKYGASKTSATQETALNPADLAVGALGIYGIDPTDATNGIKPSLITAATDAAGKRALGSFAGKEIILAQGGPQGSITTFPVQLTGIEYIKGVAYSAPVRGVSYVGWNGTAGSLNLPGSILQRDDATIGILDVTLGTEPTPKNRVSAPAIQAGESAYSILRQIVNAGNKRADVKVEFDVVSNGTETAIAHSGGTLNLTVVKGSATATFSQTSGITGIANGDNIRIAGSTYVVSNLTGGTLTLDRPYAGASATLVVDHASNPEVVKKLASITEWGVKLTDTEDFIIQKYYASGVLENATITQVTPSQKGSGAYEQVKALEKNRNAYAGYHDQLDTRVRIPELRVELNTNYALYFLKVNPTLPARNGMNETFVTAGEIILAFPDKTPVSNDNQHTAELIMEGLFTGTEGLIA